MVPLAKVVPVAGSKEAEYVIHVTHFQIFLLPFHKAELERRAFKE
jgi:hypothetical protein